MGGGTAENPSPTSHPTGSGGAQGLKGTISPRVLYIFTYFYIFLICFCTYFVDSFDVKLIVNKRGAPEAPPIHYPINFTSKESTKYVQKHIRNM